MPNYFPGGFRAAPSSTAFYPDVPRPRTAQPDPQALFRQIAAYQDLQRRRKQAPADVLLRYNSLDKLAHHLKTLFVTMPKTIWRGLKGDKDFTFSDAMLVAKFPYYLGGMFLALSPCLGGDKKEGVRLGAAALFYLLGTGVSHGLINLLYRVRYGADLTMMYRSKTGQVENVFASTDFPRFDLLTKQQYAKMAYKMGVPLDVPEPDGAIRENLRYIIPNSRALKMIVATVLSAIGAGYLARTDAWLAVPKAFPAACRIWKSPLLDPLKKLQFSFKTLAEAFRGPLLERLGTPKSPLWQRMIVWGGIATVIGTAIHVLLNGIPRKSYISGWQHPVHPYYAAQNASFFRGTA